MSDLISKSVPLPAALSGLSALAPAQVQPPLAATPAASHSVKTGTVTAVQNLKPADHKDLLARAAQNIQKYLPKQPVGTQLRIEKDKGTNLFVYKAVDPKSGKVVSQYPSQEVLRFISYFREKEGLAVDQSA